MYGLKYWGWCLILGAMAVFGRAVHCGWTGDKLLLAILASTALLWFGLQTFSLGLKREILEEIRGGAKEKQAEKKKGTGPSLGEKQPG